MVVIAIIGILAGIAIPKFAELIRKSKEGSTKGNLGSLRSALSIYYGDTEGQYPDGGLKTNGSPVLAALVPKYLAAVPPADAGGYHSSANTVYNHDTYSGHNHDFGYWGYDGVDTPAPAPDSDYGKVWVMCWHTDSKGSSWSQY